MKLRIQILVSDSIAVDQNKCLILGKGIMRRKVFMEDTVDGGRLFTQNVRGNCCLLSLSLISSYF